MANLWESIKDFKDIKYQKGLNKAEGIAKITINRPEVRNAFRPQTVFELKEAFNLARDDQSIGVIILTGEGKDAFCSGGDQKIRGDAGYVGDDGVPRLNILDVQRQIRTIPKPVIAMVAGYAVGGGHVLHLICDLTIAADNAQFGQTGPKVGSFDGGWGASYLARVVGQKRAREIWFLCKFYSADKALEWGLINQVVSYDNLEKETIEHNKFRVSGDIFSVFYTNFNLFADEAQYWLWSKTLDFGYYSKPPMIAWFLKLHTTLFGESFESLKFFFP